MMRFQLTHKLMTYLLALASLGTLCAANLIQGGVALLAVAAGALSWFVDPETRLHAWSKRFTSAWRIGASLFFAFTAYRVWRRLPEPDLTPILNLVLFLTVYKLFHRGANRDYLQISVLGFLMVVAGAAFAQSFLFVPVFVVYVVLTTWTLVLLHLRREMEENYLVKHLEPAPSHKVGVARVLNSRRVIGLPFLAATGGVALAVVVGATLTFALVPRVGTGFAFGGQRARRTLIGFSDEVTLGTSGFLSEDNDTIALRAVLPRLERATSDRQREDALDLLYWRGTIYDRYDRGRWLRSHAEVLRTHIVEAVAGPSSIREPHLGPRDEGATLAGTERQEIDIVGVSTPVAFALDHPVAFELPPAKFGTSTELRLVPRWSGEVAFHGSATDTAGSDSSGELRTFAGAHYVAYSRDPMALTRAVNGRPMAQIPAAVLAPYLAVPAALAPRFGDLARSITAGKTTPISKVIAVTRWLEATHEYSTNLDRGAAGERDPIDDFLFGRKSGHCEYFASAAALLLRSVGVPTRYVNGFLGGEWNAVGHYVTVRQNRAHAWVEAYLGEVGWMRVDATPPVRPGGRMGRLRQLLDSIDFLWGRWVVGYDLSRQIDIARDFGRGLGFGRGGEAKSTREGGAAGTAVTRALAVRVGLIAAGLTAWWLVRRRRRRRQRATLTSTGRGRSAIARLYRKCLERLAAGGHPRRPAETAREFARRIVEEQPLAGTTDFREVTELYLQARFGQQVVDGDVVAALARRLAQLGWFHQVSARQPRRAA